MKNKLNRILLLGFCLMNSNALAQSDHASNVSGSSTPLTEPLGWINTSGSINDLDIINQWNSKSINFHTMIGTTFTKKMSLLNTGEFGIGTSFTPFYKLDVDDGDINLNSLNKGYRIGAGGSTSKYVLWHNGNVSDIFVGVDAGNSTMSGHLNTLVGNSSGTSLTSGVQNTYVGYKSGRSTTSGYDNTILGYTAGELTTTGIENCFIGSYAGHDNLLGKANVFIGFKAGYKNRGSVANTGSWNTIVGFHAGENTYDGNANCYYGKYSGDKNSSGSGNSFYGSHSGQETGNSGVTNDYNCMFGNFAGRNFNSGSENIFIGYNAQNSGVASDTWNNISNSIALGCSTLVRASNNFILGNNSQKVGIGLSNDASGPQSKLEINSYPNSTSYTSTAGTGSGLQFRQLRSTSSSAYPGNYIAPYGKVLTVDGDGIVKLTDQHVGYGDCINPYILSSEPSMTMNDYNMYYEGQFYSGNDNDMFDAIGLGYPSCSTLPGKLSVDQSFTGDNVDVFTTAGYFHNGDETTTLRAYIEKKAVWGISDGIGPMDIMYNIGGQFEANTCEFGNIGVRGMAIATGDEQNNSGGWFIGNGAAAYNIGVAGTTEGGAEVDYGVYGSAPIDNCQDGSCVDAAGFFNGDVYAVGHYFIASDMNIKENIQPLQEAMTILNGLNPKSYTFRTSQFPYLNLHQESSAGLIAQEVQNVLPELVGTYKVPPRMDGSGNVDTTGAHTPFLAVNYVGIIPYLIQAVKEQQKSIDSLRIQLIETQSQIINCCGGSLRLGEQNDDHNNSSTIEVELSDIKTIVLDQNSPNPFSEETFINYTIPNSVSKALILIYDKLGQVLKTITINDRGNGTLHIYAEKLSSGIYSYSLIADGQTIDTKQMVLQK